jgi:hypothetical protein
MFLYGTVSCCHITASENKPPPHTVKDRVNTCLLGFSWLWNPMSESALGRLILLAVDRLYIRPAVRRGNNTHWTCSCGANIITELAEGHQLVNACKLGHRKNFHSIDINWICIWQFLRYKFFFILFIWTLCINNTSSEIWSIFKCLAKFNQFWPCIWFISPCIVLSIWQSVAFFEW